jgi:hypothetical protein
MGHQRSKRCRDQDKTLKKPFVPITIDGKKYYKKPHYTDTPAKEQTLLHNMWLLS